MFQYPTIPALQHLIHKSSESYESFSAYWVFDPKSCSSRLAMDGMEASHMQTSEQANTTAESPKETR